MVGYKLLDQTVPGLNKYKRQGGVIFFAYFQQSCLLPFSQMDLLSQTVLNLAISYILYN